MSNNDLIIVNDKKYSLLQKLEYNGKIYYMAIGIDEHNKFSFYDLIIVELLDDNNYQLLENTNLIKTLLQMFIKN